MSCPDCRGAAEFVKYRPRTFVSQLVEIRLERAYYHCPHCRAGFVPWDEVLRPSTDAPTPGAREVACLAGILSSFAEGNVTALPKLTGPRLSESTVERTTEAAGQDVGTRLAEGVEFGPARLGLAQGRRGQDLRLRLARRHRGRPARPERCPCGGTDGHRGDGLQPGPRGGRARASPDKPAPRFNVRYVAGLDGTASLSEPLRRQAAQVGMDRAERWIAISDGGSGLEDWLRGSFGRVDAVILDFYHATEYLGRALHPDDEAAREAWLGDWCHRLKHEGGRRSRKGFAACGRAASEALAGVTRYIEHQSHRMDYPRYVANGWAIGSGPVESACKTVVGQR